MGMSRRRSGEASDECETETGGEDRKYDEKTDEYRLILGAGE